jgi:broad specificity phosphatase PhoE
MNSLYLIRHAETFFNRIQADFESQEALNPSSQSFPDFAFDLSLADSLISPIGSSQCLEAVARAHLLPVQKVFVSPFRRALQTCQILFEAHPLKPKIIVHPFLHEAIHTTCDVSLYDGQPFREFQHFDWSLITDTFLPELFIKDEFRAEIGSGENEEKRRRLVEVMRRIYPGFIESDEEVYERAQKSKEIWRKEVESFNVALVGHSGFFKEFVKRSFQEPSTKMNNCQILEYRIE